MIGPFVIVLGILTFLIFRSEVKWLRRLWCAVLGAMGVLWLGLIVFYLSAG